MKSTYGILLQLVSERRPHRSELGEKVSVLRGKSIFLLLGALELALQPLYWVELLIAILCCPVRSTICAIGGWREGPLAVQRWSGAWAK